MNRMWLFSGFFTFSALAGGLDLPLKELTSVEQQEPADRLLYRNYDTGTTVIGKPVEMPVPIKNTLQALALFKASNDLTFTSSQNGFFATKRTFIYGTNLGESSLTVSPFTEQNESVNLHLLQHRELSRKSVPEYPREGPLTPDKVEHQLRAKINAFFKEVGIVNSPIGVFQNQWVSLEVNGYEGPIVELADFNETNTDDIYFLTVVNEHYAYNKYSFFIMQVTGIENDRQADHLKLQSIRTATINRDSQEERVWGMHFSQGVAVNPEGKVIGFLAWDRWSLDRLRLIKVTPELRKLFSENTAEAREDNQRKAAMGNGISCKSSLF